MSNSWFRFKRFTVEQHGAAMKVGTDGVLLGAWARIVPTHSRYLDIGTGTGLIALMLAQRVTEQCDERDVRRVVCSIDAVEVDPDGAQQAAANVAASPWSDFVQVYHSEIQCFRTGAVAEKPESQCLTTDSVAVKKPESQCLRTGFVNEDLDYKCFKIDLEKEKPESQCLIKDSAAEPALYDHIVSNPPWFVDSLESPHAARTAARHAGSLSYGDLLDSVKRLLSAEGIFSVVLPADSEKLFVAQAAERGFGLCRRTAVCSLPDTPPKRVLLELARAGVCEEAVEQAQLTIETGVSGCYTEQYRALTQAFYLKF